MKQGLTTANFLWAIVFAIALGVIGGWYLPHWIVRIFLTFNGVFSQFLGFLVPLLIVGLIAPSIAELGKHAGRLLIYTVGLSYIFTVLAGIFTYGATTWVYPHILQVGSPALSSLMAPQGIASYFTLPIVPLMDITTALVLAFVLGLGVSFSSTPTLKGLLFDFRTIVYAVIYKVVLPLLPWYVLGVFMNMTVNGQVAGVLAVFSKVIIFLFILTLFMLLIQFVIAGIIANKKPFSMLKTMLPAYLTALGTASSAATIPVTYRQVQALGVREDIAGFTVPLCASIHMAGSAVKIVGCATAILLLFGGNMDCWHFVGFVFMLSIAIVAGPGGPGGAIMAAVGVLEQMLGFNDQMLGLIIALYIAMDSFGTACNVTGDGAIAVIVNKWCPEK